MAVNKINNPTSIPIKRLIYSIQARVKLKVSGLNPAGRWLALKGGIQLPKHFGQSGHPKPAPDTLTNPPMKIKIYVATVDKKANFENSFNCYLIV